MMRLRTAPAIVWGLAQAINMRFCNATNAMRMHLSFAPLGRKRALAADFCSQPMKERKESSC
jgi:hypothetical protein